MLGQLYDGRRIKHLREGLGLFAQYLPLRHRLDAKFLFSDILRHNQQAAGANYTRQEYYSSERRAGSEGGRLPLPFKFDFMEWPAPRTAGGMRFSLRKIESRSDSYKLRLSVFRRETGFTFELHYDERFYSPEAVGCSPGSSGRCLRRGRESGLAGPRLGIHREDERRRLLVAWNETERITAATFCLKSCFEEQPRAPASTPAVTSAKSS